MLTRILDFLFDRDTMTGKRIIFYPLVVLWVVSVALFLLYKLATWSPCL